MAGSRFITKGFFIIKGFLPCEGVVLILCRLYIALQAVQVIQLFHQGYRRIGAALFYFSILQVINSATQAATDSDGATIGDGLDIDYVRQYIRQEILKPTGCKAEANIYVGYLNIHNCYDRN